MEAKRTPDSALPWERVTEQTVWDERAEYFCASRSGFRNSPWRYHKIHCHAGKWWEDGILSSRKYLHCHYTHRIKITAPKKQGEDS